MFCPSSQCLCVCIILQSFFSSHYLSSHDLSVPYHSDTATNTVDFGLDQLDVKRKHKQSLGDDFGIRIYLSDGNYADVTKGMEQEEEEEGGAGSGIEMGETRLQKYTEVAADLEGETDSTTL